MTLARLVLLALGVAVLTPAAANATVTVIVTPAALRLGDGARARVAVTATSDVPVDQIEIVASVGTVRGLVRVAPGRYQGVYLPPSSRAPDVALFAARVRGTSDAGTAAVALAGRYHLTVTVEPGARVAVRVGEAPEQRGIAGPDGAVDMVLHVPPGVQRARIDAVDRSGNRAESMELLSSPPAHRTVVLLCAPPVDAPRALRWLVAFATPGGTLSAVAPSVDVPGALAAVTMVRTGLFEVIARPIRRAVPRVVTARVSERGVAAGPAPPSVVIPPEVVSSATLEAGRSPRAGEDFAVLLHARSADGSEVEGLGDSVSAEIGGVAVSRVDARGGAYALFARAPERVGPALVTARLSRDGAPALEARVMVRVRPGPAHRVSADDPRLPQRAEGAVTLRAFDRYGNSAEFVRPSIVASGAQVRRVSRNADGSVAVRLVPSARVVTLSVRDDYDLRERVELDTGITPLSAAAPAALRPFSLGALATLRTNLGAVAFGGLRARFSVAGRFGVLAFVGALEAGVEWGGAGDSQGRAASVFAVPVLARAALLFVAGPIALGPVVGGGGRAVAAEARSADGEVARHGAFSPSLVGAFAVRVRLGPGAILAEIGAESGSLSGPVRGTLGGLYASLGWEFGL